MSKVVSKIKPDLIIYKGKKYLRDVRSYDEYHRLTPYLGKLMNKEMKKYRGELQSDAQGFDNNPIQKKFPTKKQLYFRLGCYIMADEHVLYLCVGWGEGSGWAIAEESVKTIHTIYKYNNKYHDEPIGWEDE